MRLRWLVARWGLLLAAALSTAAADDTLWTRTFMDGDNSLPSVVRCRGTDVFVAGSSTHDITMQGFVLKYADDGHLEWRADIGFDFFNMVMALDVGSDGQPVIGVDAGTGTPVAKLVKLGGSGDTLWTRSYPEAAIDALAVGGDNSIYTIGIRGPSGSDSLWVAKHSPDGSAVWSRCYRIAANHLIYGLGVDSQGQLYSPLLLATANGDREWSPLYKFSTSGDTAWSRTYSGASNLLGVAVDSEDNVRLLSNGSVRKIRPDGSQAWSAGASGQVAFDLAVDDQNSCYVSYTDYHRDIKVKKISSTGSAQWVMRAPYSGQDLPVSVAADGLRRPVATGISTEGSLMQVLTVKFASVPGITEAESLPSVHPRRQSPGVATRGVGVRWVVACAGRYVYRVRDGSGRQVGPSRQVWLARGSTTLDMAGIPSGVWFLEVRGPTGVEIGRFSLVD